MLLPTSNGSHFWILLKPLEFLSLRPPILAFLLLNLIFVLVCPRWEVKICSNCWQPPGEQRRLRSRCEQQSRQGYQTQC